MIVASAHSCCRATGIWMCAAGQALGASSVVRQVLMPSKGVAPRIPGFQGGSTCHPSHLEKGLVMVFQHSSPSLHGQARYAATIRQPACRVHHMMLRLAENSSLVVLPDRVNRRQPLRLLFGDGKVEKLSLERTFPPQLVVLSGSPSDSLFTRLL